MARNLDTDLHIALETTREILSFLPESRQTLLFSATLPPDIQRMAETKLHAPEFITSLTAAMISSLSRRTPSVESRPILLSIQSVR